MAIPVCNVNGCNKKINLIDEVVSLCKCGKKHCIRHRLSETHNCNYDYRGNVNKAEIIKNMKCVASKLNVI